MDMTSPSPNGIYTVYHASREGKSDMGDRDAQRSAPTCMGRIRLRRRSVQGGQRMVARICLLLILSSVLLSCRSASVSAHPAGEFGPVRILLYSELREATYGWMGDSPTPMDMEFVDYGYSYNFKALSAAIDEIIKANNEGGPHKAISAIVTGERVKVLGGVAVQIRSSSDIQIVDLPAGFFDIWKATTGPPPEVSGNG